MIGSARVALALATAVALTTALAGCGSSDQPVGGPAGGDSSGTSIGINGNDALTWGDGPYGVVSRTAPPSTRPVGRSRPPRSPTRGRP